MNSFYKGGSELSTGKGSSCSNQIEPKKYRAKSPKLLPLLWLYFASIAPVLMKYLLSTDIVLITQQLRKEIDKGKIYYKSTCRILGNYWISQGILATVKCSQRKAEKEAYSSGLRVLFGKSSRRRYTKVDSPSGALRLLFDCSSRTSRSTLEALSKPSRRIVGPIPNDSRRDLEALRKGSRTEVDQKLINRRRSSGVDNCLKRVRDFLIKASQESNTVYIQAVASSQLIMLESTVGSSLSYLKYTAEILSKYLKNTRELLNKYLIAAKELLYVSRFLVSLSAKIGGVVEFYAKVGTTELVDRGNDLCLKFKVFQVFYRCRVCEDGDFVVQQESGAQNALKCSISIFGYKRCFQLCLTCLVLIFHMFSLSAQTPRKESGAGGLIISPIGVDYRVPDDFWKQQLNVYSQGDTSLVTMAKFRGKPLIVDFWSISCASCISKFPKLQALQTEFQGNFNLMLVAQENSKQIHAMRNEFLRENKLPTVYNDKYLNTLFPHRAVPHYVWITPVGRIAAITSAEFVDHGRVKAFIDYCLQYEMPN